MSIQFSRSMRSLRLDSFRATRIGLIFAIIIMLALIVWFFMAKVTLYEGSAKNLHPILISAVERPLITSALRETGGKQIQAAELLGLNRNTLRKKIVNLHIPLKHTKAKASHSA